jgi:parvulin-like peptidyl-prolyl isomerase
MRKEIIAVSVALTFSLGVLLACKGAPPADESEMIARVREEVLTVDDLDRLDADQRKVKMPQYLTKEELMEEWIRSEVLYQQALDEKVNEEKECAWRLRNSGKGVVIQRFWELKVYEKYADVSDGEALKWYEENKDEKYRAKTTGVWLRRILLNSQESVDEVMRRLDAGEDFADVAGSKSVTPEKLDAGNLGYRRLEDVSPAYRAAVAKMKVGGIAGPFKLADFYVLIKLEDRVEAGDYLKPEGIGMEVLRDRAKVALWRETANSIGEDLEAAADIERHPERIREEAVDMALGEEGSKGGGAGTK